MRELKFRAHFFWVVKIPDLNNVQVNTRQTVQQNMTLKCNALPQINPIFWIDCEFYVQKKSSAKHTFETLADGENHSEPKKI